MNQASHAAGSARSVYRPAVLAARLVELALVAALAWTIAQAMWFAIYGTDVLTLEIQAPSPGSISADHGAGARPGPAQGLFDALEGQAGAPEAVAPQTRLDMTLRGVRSGADGTGGSAVIETPDRGQRIVAAGGEVAPGVTLQAVFEDRVIINRNGARESLFLTEAAARRARDAREPGRARTPDRPGAFTEPVSALSGRPDPARALALDREDWIEGLRLRPALESGRLVGFEVRDNTTIEVLRASGLMPGDVVTRLNGQALTSAEAAARAVRGLETADRLAVTVRRQGDEMTLEAPLN